MCGICGVMNFSRGNHVDRLALEAMNQRIVHRGPDDDGFYLSENVGLAMRRLSIIDVRAGHQPVTNEDSTVWLVYNGEIYNHQELRNRLETLGHHFQSRSDTETIVHLYEQYGRDCVKHLRGMFAFALWERAGAACSSPEIDLGSSLSTIRSPLKDSCSGPKSRL